MKRVLVPVDFTEVAFNALKYALRRYGQNAEYHVVHVYSGLATADNPLPTDTSIQITESTEAQIEKIILDLLEFDTLPGNIKIRTISGETISSLVSLSKEENFTNVVVGTRDNYDMLDRWFGTTSLGLVKKLDIPILLIPRYSAFSKFNKVVIASDHHLKDNKLISKIKEWNKTHKAYLKFLHVRSEEEVGFTEESQQLVKALFEEDDPEYGFEITAIKSKKVTESLLASAYNFKADLLIILAEKHSYLHTLVFQSVSKEIILKSSIPVLFLHT